MHGQYHPPMYLGGSFHCPECHAFSSQDWRDMVARRGSSSFKEVQGFSVSFCNHCEKPALWIGRQLIYPDVSTAEPPSPDLPVEIQADYDEARGIVNRSPRGAAALLRLCIQKLCAQLGEPGKNINSDIASLVTKGLPQGVQQALDAVRVIGNEAVHPGTIDLRDDRDTANRLFKMVNFIAAKMITEPNEIAAMYGSLPASKIAEIEKRDGRA